MSLSSSDLVKRTVPLTTTQRAGLILAAIVLIVPMLINMPGLSLEGRRVFGIFLMAVVLWITEAIPLHATAAVIILLEILFISDQSPLPQSGDSPAPHKLFFETLASPILMLFLGGFVLADCSAKYALDKNLARVLLAPFGKKPAMIMLGLMLITAILSMFMSNTATTATMMAVVIPVVAQLPPNDKMRTGLVLAIPVAANVGGMGTPIGTPPNAIAVGALALNGVRIGFVTWMMMMVPYMIIVLITAWSILKVAFRTNVSEMSVRIDTKFDKSVGAWIFYITFVITIGLWLTEKLHGFSSSVVGFLPVTVLLATRVFSTRDLQSVQWHVLWLVAGGIALGVGVGQTGLDVYLISLVAWNELGSFLLGTVLVFVALVFGTLMSHSATANLLVPLAMSLSVSSAVAIDPVLAAVFVAAGASLAMALPISTPPNAIAVSTGMVETKHMAPIGIVLGLFGALLFITSAGWFWGMLGVLNK